MMPGGRGQREWAAILLLLFGGFIFAIGWIVGVVLLWTSRSWTTRDKLIGTFVLPGGLMGAIYIVLRGVRGTLNACLVPLIRGLEPGGSGITSAGQAHCTKASTTIAGVPSNIMLPILLLLPFATAVYLAYRAGHRGRLVAR